MKTMSEANVKADKANQTAAVKLNPGERIDDLLTSGLKIIQNENEFCFSLDAVLIAHFATIKKNACGLDLGTGTGVIPLLLSLRAKRIDALEINEVTADIARRNMEMNNLADRIFVRRGDLRRIEEYYKPESMDFVISNPPYRQINQGRLNLLDGVARARHEVTAKLDDVVKAASYALKYRGRFAMVHLPERLGEIMVAMSSHQIEPKRLQLVQPKREKAPNIALIEGIKCGAPGAMQVEPALIVHEDNGDYSQKLMEYYYPDNYK